MIWKILWLLPAISSWLPYMHLLEDILNSSKCTCNKSGSQTHKRPKHSSVNVCHVYLREKKYIYWLSSLLIPGVSIY